MAIFEARIDVTHRAGILDPAGATVERALPALGWDNVAAVSIGKTIRCTIAAETAASAEAQVAAMCEKLLANPVIEDYVFTICEVAPA